MLVATLIALIAISTPVQAETFMGGSWTWLHQNTPVLNSGGAGPSISREGIGGISHGVGVVGGGLITRRFGWSAELWLPPVDSEYTQAASLYRTRGTYKTWMFTGLVLFRNVDFPLEWVLGGSWVRQRLTRELAHFDFRTAAYEPFAGNARAFELPHAVAATVGANLLIPVGRRVTLVPQFRMHLVSRDDDQPTIGLGSRVWRVGIGARVPF